MSVLRRKPGHRRSESGELHQSSAYHRYFEGWAEREILNASGRITIKRVYVGTRYRMDLSPAARRLWKCGLWAAVLAGTACLLAGSVQDITQNQSPILAVLQVIAAGGHAASFLALSNLRADMTIYEYRSGPRALLRSASITACICVLCLSAVLLLPSDRGAPPVSAAVFFALAALSCRTAAFAARRLPIRAEENTTPIPDGSVIIRRAGE